MSQLFVNLGRSLIRGGGEGILPEAQAMFGEDRKVFVLALEGDRLLDEVGVPEGAELILVRPDGAPIQPVIIEPDAVFVLNGGITPNAACMLVHLSDGCKIGRVVNMQRDGCMEMTPRPE